ncbi:GLPGLI family protein [Flavobacterium aquidurense]|uniref:Peptide-N-glycosidase n=1 Tax=Flavobacterium frigidimaris TaxID=262320 RepID=A0ABX4BK26_FLAFR|nr:GLPGLI family protein [Flavobacterium frigidimaris]OXA75711.1 peptide-N-glycosidase [Flavobacterium frigidimaris]SDZ63474.1 GLPGLI family protein [Flavobacterium aquidurense]
MKKILFTFLTFCLITISFAQKTPKAIKVTYQRSSNGKVIPNQDPLFLYASKDLSLITTDKILQQKANLPFEQTFVTFNSKTISQLANLKGNKSILTHDTEALEKQKFEFTAETKKILNFTCKKAIIVVNSNKIEIWYTTELGLKGGPSTLGQDLGLVLETIRNGNSALTATKIETLKTIPSLLAIPNVPEADQLTYKDLLWKSRFVNISVFNKEQINFVEGAKSNDSIFRYASGTVIVRKVKFPEIKKGSSVYVDVTQQSNGDAYDRTGSVFMIPMDKKASFLDGLKNGVNTLPFYENGNGKKYQGVVATNDYAPLLELMRFFTPFGVKHFNYLEQKNKVWQDSVFYRQEISLLQSKLSNQEVYIGMFIGNYDAGGHKASLNISIHQGEDNNPKGDFILPLFNTLNVMEMAGQEYATMFDNEKGLEMSFEVPEGYKNFKLSYTTTGHGGWENGDEFLQKKNTILIDGKEVFGFTPWRTDCGSYRLSNPASGNFGSGLSSSDLSRSNWCPGTTTNPNLIDLGNLSPGKHTIRVSIPLGKPEGTSSSAWNVSGFLIGEK